MTSYLNPVTYTISADDAYKLSLYIGQYLAPTASATTITTRVNTSGVRNVYPLVPSDGSSGVAQDGGVTIQSAATSGTASVSMVTTSNPIQYNLNYSPNPNFVGNDSFTYRIQNPAGSNTYSVNVTVVGVTSGGTASGATGQAFNYNITTNGTPSGGSPYSVTGTLPNGVTVNSGTGAISGTPSETAAGIYSVTVNVLTTIGTVSKDLTITVDGITSSSTANGTQGSPMTAYQVSSQLSASSFGLTGLPGPGGLSFNTTNGLLTGTPVSSGTYNFTMSATTASGTQQRSLTLTIASAGAPVVSTTPALSANPTPNVVGQVNTAISNITVSGTNPPLTAGSFTASGLPTGLNINATSGVISGTPTVSGDFTATLGVSNASGAGSLTVVMRVNAIAAPTINSGSTASGAVGTSATQYTITTDGTNGPIKATGGYSVFSGTLPAGLSLNADTGVVSGNPTASGVSTVTFAAENTGNVKGTKSVTFTINPNAAPAITSPTNGTTTALSLGVATSISVVASNPPILSYAISSGALPTGVSLNTSTGVISGTPSATSASTPVSITATNAIGTSAAVTLNFSVSAPTPGACSITTTVNVAATQDLKPCMFPSLNPTGVSVSLAPAFGTVTTSGTSVTYTPNSNFFGTDTFQAVAYFGTATPSSASTVTVTVGGTRPDPTLDPKVTSALQSQAQAAMQTALTQTSNIQTHLTGIRTRLARGPSAPTAVAFRGGDERPAKLTLSEELASIGKNDATQLPGTASKASLPVSAGVATIANAAGLSSNPIYNIASGLVQNQQLNLGTVSSALDSTIPDGTLPGPKIWAEGVISYGARDASGSTSATDYNTAGITFGTDFTLTKQVVTGMAIGFAKGTTNIGTDGTQSRSRGTSVAVYGSYQPEGKGFVEGLIGLSTLDYDLQRYVSAASAFALSNRKGLQLFGSVGGGWEFRDKGRMLSPYGRIDFSTGRLNETTETGAGSFALKYDDQTNTSLQGSLGLSVESTHSTSFGWAVPRARVELRKDLQNKSEATISYADQVGGTRYSISPTGTLNSAVVLGVGSNFIFRDGWGLGLDYQLTQASATESSYALRLKLVKQLGVKGLPDLLAGVEFEPGDDDGAWQIDAGSTWDDNITRAKAGSDVRADSIYNINASRSATVYRAGNSRVILTGVAGGERFHSTNGLSNVSLTGEAVYQYRASSDFDTPTYGIFGRVTALKHQSNLRDGARYAIGMTAMQPFTDRLTGFVALSHNRRSANSTVFTTADSSLRANLDLALRSGATLYVTGEYRDGDIVSTGRSSLENITIAKVLVQDDAYTGGQFFSYRFGGTTLLTTVGYNVGLGPRDSIDIAWRRVESTPTIRPSWATSPNSYITNQVSASYLMRF